MTMGGCCLAMRMCRLSSCARSIPRAVLLLHAPGKAHAAAFAMATSVSETADSLCAACMAGLVQHHAQLLYTTAMPLFVRQRNSNMCRSVSLLARNRESAD